MSRGRFLRSQRSLTVGAMVCVIVAGCGAASDSSAATDTSPSSPDTSLTDATTPETSALDARPASTPPTSSAQGQTAAPEPLPEGYREFVVDGVTVRVRTDLDALPEQATEIEHGGTLIDAGEGPMFGTAEIVAGS